MYIHILCFLDFHAFGTFIAVLFSRVWCSTDRAIASNWIKMVKYVAAAPIIWNVMVWLKALAAYNVKRKIAYEYMKGWLFLYLPYKQRPNWMEIDRSWALAPYARFVGENVSIAISLPNNLIYATIYWSALRYVWPATAREFINHTRLCKVNTLCCIRVTSFVTLVPVLMIIMINALNTIDQIILPMHSNWNS